MTVKVTSTGSTSFVKQVKVGTPGRRVTAGIVNINTLEGVDTSAKTDGSVLVFNASTSKFEATTTLDKQQINGGNF